MASAMASTPIFRKPSARASALGRWPVSRSTSAASRAKPASTAGRSRGSFWLAPKTLGKYLGCSLPVITLQSVMVRGPPRRYAAGPGSAPALSGPTRRRVPSNRQMEPPPAATVWMLIMGARMRTPATSVSSVRSYSPAKCATSVEVPPMSNVTKRSYPAATDVLTAATMPPAGPDRMASFPWNTVASVRPPLLCMNCRRVPPPSSAATCSTYRRRMGLR
mmetsp:Transcript_5844/g.16555  ORF Transcript_5844/g.16555 Transcript_5844/m.16555 type:complete len:220 (+) Transcript_5844:98-757(+)